MKQNIKKKHRLGVLWWYLIIVVLLSIFCYITLHKLLLPYSISHEETGEMSLGYLLYIIIGLFFSTPAPFVAVLIIYLVREKKSVKQLFKDIFRTEKPVKALLVVGFFCALSLIYAVTYGERNDAAWYMFIVGFVVMLPFVGIAEETGWRGLLQPELDKRMPFPISVIVTGLIWCVWHFPDWLDPTSRHAGDSMIGFGICILIWSFVMAAIYKATKSIIACASYHAFMDAIGAIYDWNALFDPFPGNTPANIYRIVWLIAAIVLWILADRNEKRKRLKAIN